MEKKAKYIQAKEALIERFKTEEYRDRQKIPTENDLIEQMGYSRNTIRQAIIELEKDGIVKKEQGRGTFYTSGKASRGTGRIGVVNFFMARSIYPYLLHGIEEVIWHGGYTLIQSTSGLAGVEELDTIKRIVSQGIDGIIYEPHHNSLNERNKEGMEILEYLGSLGIPVVTTHFYLPRLQCSSVVLDDRKIGYDAVRYLHDHGHREIGIFYISQVQSGAERFDGFTAAMRDLGLKINPDWEIMIRSGEDDAEDPQVVSRLTQFLGQNNRPTAFFCFNDELAVLFYEAARNAGLVVGRDISVIGVDNLSSAEVLHPGLTTFNHPKENLGKWAARILLTELKNPGEPKIQGLFHPELIERHSVADLT